MDMRKSTNVVLAYFILMASLLSTFGQNDLYANPKVINIGRDMISEDSTEIQKKTVAALHERFGHDFRRLSVERNGVITGILGPDLDIGLDAKKPEDRAFQFLEKNKDIFQIENAREEFFIDKRNPEQALDIVELRQMVKGVEVFGGHYSFRFLPDSNKVIGISSIRGHIYPGARDFDPIPKISEKDARDIALRDSTVRNYNPSVNKPGKLFIRRYREVTRLVWDLVVDVDGGCELKKFIYAIDAKTGEVISARCYRLP